MATTQKDQKAPLYLEYILCLTAFAAGAVDIISFARLGGIFASAMTGNLAFLGLYIARLSFNSAIGSGIALLGFVIGTATGNLTTRGKARGPSLNILLGTESVLLTGVAALWFPWPHPNGSLAADALITLLSVSMGLQSIVGKKINLSNIPTIVFTSTLTNLVIGITDTLADKKFSLPKDTRRQATSFTIYFLGALAAGICAYIKSPAMIFLPLGAVLIALLVRNFHPSGVE